MFMDLMKLEPNYDLDCQCNEETRTRLYYRKQTPNALVHNIIAADLFMFKQQTLER